MSEPAHVIAHVRHWAKCYQHGVPGDAVRAPLAEYPACHAPDGTQPMPACEHWLPGEDGAVILAPVPECGVCVANLDPPDMGSADQDPGETPDMEPTQ